MKKKKRILMTRAVMIAIAVMSIGNIVYAGEQEPKAVVIKEATADNNGLGATSDTGTGTYNSTDNNKQTDTDITDANIAPDETVQEPDNEVILSDMDAIINALSAAGYNIEKGLTDEETLISVKNAVVTLVDQNIEMKRNYEKIKVELYGVETPWEDINIKTFSEVVGEISALKSNLKAALAQNGTTADKFNSIITSLADLKTSITTLNTSNETLTAQLTNLKGTDSSKTVELLSSQVATLNSQVASLSTKNASLEAENAALIAKNNTLQNSQSKNNSTSGTSSSTNSQTSQNEKPTQAAAVVKTEDKVLNTPTGTKNNDTVAVTVKETEKQYDINELISFNITRGKIETSVEEQTQETTVEETTTIEEITQNPQDNDNNGKAILFVSGILILVIICICGLVYYIIRKKKNEDVLINGIEKKPVSPKQKEPDIVEDNSDDYDDEDYDDEEEDDDEYDYEDDYDDDSEDD